MLKAQVLSDNHLEMPDHRRASFYSATVEDIVAQGEAADLLILAGDFTSIRHLEGDLDCIYEHYQDIVYVPGNHEYYGQVSVAAGKQAIREIIESFPNIHLLDNDVVTIEDVDFIGTTLWPDLDHVSAEQRTLIYRSLNDFSCIGGMYKDLDQLAIDCKDFLDQAFYDSKFRAPRKRILVTHFVPYPMSLDPRFAGSPLNPYFIANYENYLERQEIDLAIHGHTHTSFNYQTAKGTQVVCNPAGYYCGEENPKYTHSLILEI